MQQLGTKQERRRDPYRFDLSHQFALYFLGTFILELDFSELFHHFTAHTFDFIAFKFFLVQRCLLQFPYFVLALGVAI